MIRAVLVMNTQGKPRLAKFYEFQVSCSLCCSFSSRPCRSDRFLMVSMPFQHPVEKQQELMRSIFGVLCSRAEGTSNFIEADAIYCPGTKLVYKHYATLYLVFVFDSCENELAMLDLIQVFVETLDKCFKNVCELDIVFNFKKLHALLDEIILGGQVLETSSTDIMKAVEEISRMEKSSNAVNLLSKSASSWIGK